MNHGYDRRRCRARVLIPILLLCGAELPAATEARADDSNAEEETVRLSPFSVTTDRDHGYRATNATSGTRLDASILQLPMPIEVITAEFIADTGATNLRHALQYSAGIQLQSQNDYAGNGLLQYRNAGGVNNPEMQTGNKSDSVIVMRGFTTENALRDGFRRRVTTDTANISRIEVVRGPSALLYGVGNFGGVVNYMVKKPSFTRPQKELTFSAGSHELLRATLDVSAPLDAGKRPAAYRVNIAAHQNGDATDYYRVRRFAVAPIFVFRPWTDTEVTLDLEYGRSRTDGIGFQSIRARADAIGNNGRAEHAGFIAFPGVSLRTMRWSGPETVRRARQGNLQLKIVHRFAEGVDLLAAYNRSSVTFDTRDVDASIGNNLGPSSLWATLYPVPLDASRGDTDANWAATPVPHSIVAYSWQALREGTRADQARIELTLRRRTFDPDRWHGMDHTVLVGADVERDRNTRAVSTLDAAGNVYNWKSPADSSPFRFATQGDGSPSLPLRLRSLSESTTRELGGYVIYHGRFWRDRVTLFAGSRLDRNGVSVWDRAYRYADGSESASSSLAPPHKTYRPNQFGVSVQPLHGVTLYALRSRGLNPNFSGTRDLTGRPMDAVTAKNEEYGVKLDLFHGRLSGTISRYRILRSGQPNATFWWAPQTAQHRFDPSKPTVYNVTDLNPDAATRYFYRDNTGQTVPLIQWNNNYAYWGDLTRYSSVPAGAAGASATAAGLRSYANDGLNPMRTSVVDTWTAAKQAGAVGYWDASGRPIDEPTFAALAASQGPAGGYITLNASMPSGAAYLDAVYNYTRSAGEKHVGSDNWPGWYFNSAPASTGYNSAALDTNAFVHNPPLSAPESDRNEGWDGQFILSPTDDLQLLFSFHRNNHTILSRGQFPTYPYQGQDRWAPWMFPNGQWGLSGFYGQNVQYARESDTSTFQFKGLIHPGAQGMDYPKWSWSTFAAYRPAALGWKHIRLGGGVVRTGPQEYQSGFTHAGDALKDNDGLPLILHTRARWTVNVFARYELRLRGRDISVQANIDNLLDDQHRYGLLWAPGRSVRVTVATTW